MYEITKIEIKVLEKPLSRLYGTANIVLDNMIAINDIKIIRLEDRFCVAFPRDENARKHGRETIVSFRQEARFIFENTILRKFYVEAKIKYGRNYHWINV